MYDEQNTSVVKKAARAIYEDLNEEQKAGYYMQAQAALKAFLSSMEKIVNESR